MAKALKEGIMLLRMFALTFLLALAQIPGAFAQEITLFQNENFSGPNISANNSIPNLDSTGFNDRASSVQIRSGAWQLCADAFYRGQCVTLQPGNYASLALLGLNNAVSSIREVGWNSGGGVGSSGGGVGSSGGAIVLYDSPGMTGRSVSLTGPVANFDDIRFNDRASSGIVSRGTWQICSDANFLGNCEVFRPGRYDNLGAVTSQASSARMIDGSGSAGGGMGGGNNGGGWGSGGSGGGWQGGPRIVLYEGTNFSGRSYMVSTDVLTNLGNSGFNDRASSLRVEQGYWMFCTDANFGGECRTLGPGDYPSLPYGLKNSISSARKISNNYPYNQRPNW
ncbi:MAG: beta/gamma crystallin-related protein [Betaproteobacteria bacterium]